MKAGKNAHAHAHARAQEKAPVPGSDTPEAQRLDRICARIRSGSSLSAACWQEGLNPKALRSTMTRNEAVEAAVEAARHAAEDARLRTLEVLVAEGKPVGGVTWALERLHRAEFHLPTKIAMGGDAEAPPVASTVTITLADAIEAARQKDDE